MKKSISYFSLFCLFCLFFIISFYSLANIYTEGKTYTIPGEISVRDFDRNGSETSLFIPAEGIGNLHLVEKLQYNIDVIQSGKYTVRLLVDSPLGIKYLDIYYISVENDNRETIKNFVRIPSTGYWGNHYVTFSDPVDLEKGRYKLVFKTEDGNFNLLRMKVMSMGVPNDDSFQNNNYEFDPTDKWKLVWADEFNEDKLNENNWNILHRLTHNNCEMQKYIGHDGDPQDNIRIENNKLIIEAQYNNKDFTGKIYDRPEYTSGRINSQYKKSFKYGRLEARIQLPQGVATWPAFWMLGNKRDTVVPYRDEFWPECGEIDVIESDGEFLQGALQSGGNGLWTQHNRIIPHVDLRKDYHVYAIEWNETEIKWYIDEILYFKVVNISPEGLNNNDHYFPFGKYNDDKFHIILNVAIGGHIFPENDRFYIPPSHFPLQMKVDYVRLYKLKK